MGGVDVDDHGAVRQPENFQRLLYRHVADVIFVFVVIAHDVREATHLGRQCIRRCLPDIGFEDRGGARHGLRIGGRFFLFFPNGWHLEGPRLWPEMTEQCVQWTKDRAPLEKRADDQHARAQQHRADPLLAQEHHDEQRYADNDQ